MLSSFCSPLLAGPGPFEPLNGDSVRGRLIVVSILRPVCWLTIERRTFAAMGAARRTQRPKAECDRSPIRSCRTSFSGPQLPVVWLSQFCWFWLASSFWLPSSVASNRSKASFEFSMRVRGSRAGREQRAPGQWHERQL
jgi:hypothetical protein